METNDMMIGLDIPVHWVPYQGSGDKTWMWRKPEVIKKPSLTGVVSPVSGAVPKVLNGVWYWCKKASKEKEETVLIAVDTRCKCGSCELCKKRKVRNGDYRLVTACINCQWKGIMIFDKGTKPSIREECPNCECSWVLRFDGDPKFNTQVSVEKKKKEEI